MNLLTDEYFDHMAFCNQPLALESIAYEVRVLVW